MPFACLVLGMRRRKAGNQQKGGECEAQLHGRGVLSVESGRDTRG